MPVSITKRKNKKSVSYQLCIDYGMVNGERDRDYITVNSYPEAKKMKSEIESQMNNNSFIRPNNMTFFELLEYWIKDYVLNECADDTAYNYELINEKYLKPSLGHIPIQKLTVQHIDEYLKYIRLDEKGPKLKFSTAKKHKANISGSLTFGITKGLLNKNVAIYSSIPSTEDERLEDDIDDINNINDIDDLISDTEKKALNANQASIVLNLFADTDMLLPVAIAMFLNPRRSEICAILKNKLNKDKKIILINAVVVRGKNGLKFLVRNKSKSSRRAFYIPNVLMQIIELDERRKKRNKLLLGSNYIESEHLCVKDDGSPLKPDYVSRRFTETLDKYIENERQKDPNFKFPRITFHDLRHTNITLLLEEGAIITDVQKAAGHSSISTTMGYTHQYNLNKKQLADTIDKIFISAIDQ